MISDVPSFAEELAVARAAASEAAALLVARSGADRVRVKARSDLVTEVDLASERLIVAKLRSRFPGDAIVAEENTSGDTASNSVRRWIIDPVDGTANYVHGYPFCCVSIALHDARGPAVAVIDAPFLGEVFHATRGGGAFLNDAPITVSSVTSGSDSLFATGFPFRPGKGEPEPFFRLVSEVMLNAHDVRRAGSAALDLAYVACGRVDGYFELGLFPWDIAAGMLLVTEAGGVAGPWPGDPQPAIETGRILATNGHVQSWLEEMVSRFDL